MDVIATCLCGKMVSHTVDIEKNPVDIDALKGAGYNVLVGENLEPREFCLGPCPEVDDCAFGRVYNDRTTGRFSVLDGEKPEDCHAKYKKLVSGDSTTDEDCQEVEW